ncbi:hypothetical protein Pyn_14464 [Prunus yedoensis var. nudiflora]|uniref:Uncharacterized protein n=1 Tax=Prunus yedoensis var. nudiflora TaxID=2094558 RepID=A0A314XXF7_PRUYE|nr:hypothetical protein Pyn_14464 [Prunus yedoensis var. nudiflora]
MVSYVYKWWKQNYAKGVAKPGQGGVQKRATVTNNARIGRVQSMVLAMESFQEKLFLLFRMLIVKSVTHVMDVLVV